MASLVRNSSGIYSIRFRVGSQRFNRSLETARQREAQDEKARIEKTIRRIKEGELDLPESPFRKILISLATRFEGEADQKRGIEIIEGCIDQFIRSYKEAA